MVKTIYVVELSAEGKYVAHQEFRSTVERIATLDQSMDDNLDRMLKTGLSYGTYMDTIATTVYRLIGRRDYRDRKRLEKLVYHLLIAFIIAFRGEVGEAFFDDLRTRDHWLLQLWPNETGQMRGYFNSITSFEPGDVTASPDLAPIDIWNMSSPYG